jgi:hypothetical protein
MRNAWKVTAAMVLAAGAASAQGVPGGPTPRVGVSTNNIRLDGRLDEAAWMLADSISDFHQKDPLEGQTPSERTVVRMLATPAGLAVGWWLYDKDPEHRIRTQLRRDASLRSDDYVSMMVDGLSDQRSAFYFRVNSNGALWDGEHINTEIGNEEWDGIWDARAAVTSVGWTAEMLIPWTTLRYPSDVKSMRVNFRRFLPRTNEEILWRAWRRTQGYRFLEEAGTVEGFPELPPRARAEFRPVVVGEARLPERTVQPDLSELVIAPADEKVKLGLDVKVPVTPTLTADVTIFPDFAQAEADRQVVNLTRFPLFFPELRPFFTEGANTFAFGREAQTQLFYSRRIGRDAAGLPVDIPFGVRVQGRLGDNQVGLLAARTAGSEDATQAVARIKRDVLRRGFVGAMATYSDKATRPGSVAGGVDFELPMLVGDDQNLIFLGNASFSTDSVGGATGSNFRFVVDYPNDRADIVTRFDRIEAAFDPALGFVSQNGIYRWGGNTNITPRPRGPSPIRRWEFNALQYDIVWDLQGRLDNVGLLVRPLGATFQAGDRVELNLIRRFDALAADFDIFPGVTVPTGEYWWNRAEVKWVSSNVRSWIVETAVSGGGFYDGDRVDASVATTIRRQPHLEVRVEYARNDVTLPSASFVANTVLLRADYAFSPRLITTLFAQANDQMERASTNLRMRWTTSPGSDLYVVWTSTWRTDLGTGVPWERPLQGGLVVKYVRFMRW